ncbi:PAS domain-containing sensor histidine kinase [Desulfospira joergensenii]|uniref:PAS domain-containing sensor histidine kinase n=1 Tax=Desulfospira joergensenii TaxID=53329 RepID=UPI0003B55007|nr:ATP-binding protein [Desulfospira joergensenii]
MNFDLHGLKIAIIGGSDPCARILDMLTGPGLSKLDIRVVMVADTLVNSKGVVRARELGIPVETDYAEVCNRQDLDLILKLKNDEALTPMLETIDSCSMRVIDLDTYQAGSFINFLEIQEKILQIKDRLGDKKVTREDLAGLFDEFSDQVIQVADQRNLHLKNERETLLEMEKELTQIIQGSMIPTFIINNEHIITHWNRACEDLTGHRAYELVGTDRQWVPFRSAKRPTMADVVVSQMSEEDVKKYYGTSWRKSNIIKEAYEAEEFFPHLGENGKWIFFTAAPIKSPDGKIIGAIETLLDQTEDKKAKTEIDLQDRELAKLHEKYKASEEKYRSLFNNNPNPIFIIDRGTLEILDINHRVEGEYGYSKADLLGSSFLEIGEKDDKIIKKRFMELGRGEAALFTKKRHFKKSKQAFYVNIKVVNARYSHRDVLIASTTDITESIEKETQLIQAGKLATLGTMAAGMAHEINQPLNVIQICADLMLKMIKKGISIPEDELKGMAEDIIDNVARAAGVIKHVRDFSRQSERDLKKLDLNDPISDVFKVLGHQLTVHSIKVNLDLDSDLPPIRAEHNRLEQVFINLVTNAIDAMDEKEAKAKAGQGGDEPVEKKLTITTRSSGKEVIAVVSDTGVGMSEEVRQKIFEPFFTTKETGKGTGLGTSISFGIIKDYSGTIEIESEEGVGSNFTIKFPAIE